MVEPVSPDGEKPLERARKRLMRGEAKPKPRKSRARKYRHKKPGPPKKGAEPDHLKAARAAHRKVTIYLTQTHRITSSPKTREVFNKAKGKYQYVPIPGTGGQWTYGPGSVTVDAQTALVLLEQERNVQREVEAFHGQKSGIITGPGKSYNVPHELFDHYLGSAMPIDPRNLPDASQLIGASRA